MQRAALSPLIGTVAEWILAKPMSAQLRTLYRNAIEFITFVKLDAPDFAPEDKLTCETAVARIRGYLDDLGEIEKKEISVRWLKLCAQDVTTAEKLFTRQLILRRKVRRVQFDERDEF